MKEEIVESALGPGCQQSEVADIVDVTVRDLKAQSMDKLGHRVSGLNSTSGFEVLGQESDLFRSSLQDAVLGDGRSPNIAASIAKDLPLTPHLPAVYMPPPSILLIPQLVEFPGAEVCGQQAMSIGPTNA